MDCYCMGKARIENPFFDLFNMPDQTGDLIDEWMSKVEAWYSGWDHADSLSAVGIVDHVCEY